MGVDVDRDKVVDVHRLRSVCWWGLGLLRGAALADKAALRPS